MSVKLSFHGAAGTVTGSCYRVTHPEGAFLVDCGLFQGNKTVRALNDKPFPFDASQLDFLLLTHGHIDHTGLLPKLAKNGYDAPLYATRPTVDLLDFMLRDSANIQEFEAERRNRKRQRDGKKPIPPAYTTEDAEVILKNMKRKTYGKWFSPGKGVRVRLHNAGHILGSASVEVHVKNADGKTIKILFSGDIGPDEKAFYRQPDAPSGFDYILTEGTYGDRDRVDRTLEDRREVLKKALKAGLERGGNVLIPAFAVERSQELLHDIAVLLNAGAIPEATVYLDSPLARKVTSVFAKYAHEFADIAVDPKQLFKHPNFKIIQSVDQSKKLNEVTKGAIIMAASGMCEAGRIKHHLRNNLWRDDATVLFVGYQGRGTLGSVIQGGAKQVFIHGRKVKCRASIETISGFSAHADQPELLDWVMDRQPTKKGIFITHADPKARQTMKTELVAKGLDADMIHLPQLDETVELTPSGFGTRTVPSADAQRIEEPALQDDWTSKRAAFEVALDEKLEGLSEAERVKLLDALVVVMG